MNRKLTASVVKEIRTLYHSNDIGYKALAKRYNISRSTVKDIIKRKTWKEVL
jgi:predicted DNA-binding protein YlxM (UPF0122 family)